MRHGKKINHLGRTNTHRKAMMANMASSLILHKRITTTTAKAKALRTYIEPLISKAKSDNTHSRRVVFSYLKDKYAVSELFRDVAEKVGERPGGYTRILKTGKRQGDNAEMCFIELVDYNETYQVNEGSKSKGGKKRRRRGGKKKSSTETQAAETQQSAEASQQEEEKKEEQSAEEPQAKKEEKKASGAQETDSTETKAEKETDDKKKDNTEDKE
mgnify:CR=1 FL=1